MISVLWVEDEDVGFDDGLATLGDLTEQLDITLVEDSDSALNELARREFDLILCDLMIPSSRGGLDKSIEHGFAVHAAARKLCPGTPLVFLTSQATTKNTKNHLSSGGTATIAGIPEFRIVQLAEKDDPSALLDAVVPLINGLREHGSHLDISATDSTPPTSLQRRVIASYADVVSANRVEVAQLGGLSGAMVCRADFYDQQRALATVVLKLAARELIEDETGRYHTHVSGQLEIGTFAPQAVPPLLHGLGKHAATISKLADPSSRSLFLLTQKSEADSARAIQMLSTALAPWDKTRTEATVTLTELRRSRVADDYLQQLCPDLLSGEDVEVSIRNTLSHGDLHGENVLVGDRIQPVLIDFGDVREAPSGTDPIALELSLFAHRDGPARSTVWPTVDQLAGWFDLDLYLRGCPYPDFVRACRTWAAEVANARQIASALYVQSLRKLKHPDADHDKAVVLARAARLHLN